MHEAGPDGTPQDPLQKMRRRTTMTMTTGRQPVEWWRTLSASSHLCCHLSKVKRQAGDITTVPLSPDAGPLTRVGSKRPPTSEKRTQKKTMKRKKKRKRRRKRRRKTGSRAQGPGFREGRHGRGTAFAGGSGAGGVVAVGGTG